jgi:hypothetical protein
MSVTPEDASLELRFGYCRNGVTYVGSGAARNLTKLEVYIESDQPLPCSGSIKLHIAWPFLLQGVCPLELVIEGWIEQQNSLTTVVSIQDYEFKTCGDQSFAPAMARGAACDLVA